MTLVFKFFYIYKLYIALSIDWHRVSSKPELAGTRKVHRLEEGSVCGDGLPFYKGWNDNTECYRESKKDRRNSQAFSGQCEAWWHHWYINFNIFNIKYDEGMTLNFNVTILLALLSIAVTRIK